jgi:hypothetical protein
MAARHDPHFWQTHVAVDFNANGGTGRTLPYRFVMNFRLGRFCLDRILAKAK